MKPLVLSDLLAAELIEVRDAGKAKAPASPDLGLTREQAVLDERGVEFSGGRRVSWEDLEAAASFDQKCFLIEDGLHEIRNFSETTGWVRSLLPTEGAPTVLVSGFPMHRIKDVEPMEDSKRKIATVAPTTGRVLDTATGLGYTAILAARRAKEVVTVELDPAALEIARLNPWSEELFTRSNIRQIVGDIEAEIARFRDAEFDTILHDPPTISLAGGLYSEEFYRQLRRVLKRSGKLFHYVGDPASGLGGRTTEGVIRRLHHAGFDRVDRRPEAFGVLAYSHPGHRPRRRG
jgi:uncharacterized protein